MKRCEVEPGTHLAVQDVGEGPAVVLVAGFGLDHTLWDRTVRVLACAGYRVVCVDQRGHGESDRPLAGYGLERLTDDLAAVLDALALRDVTLVGHSFGGQVAFRLAAERPDLVTRLVLVGSNGVRASRSADFPFGAPPEQVLPGLLQDEEENRVTSRRRALVSAFARKPAEEVVSWLVATSMKFPSWAAVACYTTMMEADQLSRIPQVLQPVLQVIGSEDPVHSARGARWLSENLTRATLVELPECGHYPMLEHPSGLELALLDFVNPAADGTSPSQRKPPHA